MSYYNAYRPTRWHDVIGHAGVLHILGGQVRSGQYAHSYLFHGSSGSGKTTVARLLAMSLNCQNMNGTGEPCGTCPDCRNTAKGSHWDVLELDAGRFRGIDDVRDLCFKASYSPMSRYKVFIIDECHQLTEAAWNAMLKTLEEPPPYLVMICVTTELARIPLTIQSRCQLFQFRAIGPEDIVAKLRRIADTENVKISDSDLTALAGQARSNLRSAENMLEQWASGTKAVQFSISI